MADAHQSKSYAEDSPLGSPVAYDVRYNPDILHPVARSDYRQTLSTRKATERANSQGSNMPNMLSEAASHGIDYWHCYELSWLNSKGRPEVRAARISIPADSDNIVESKSLKLYLHSLNNHQFRNEHELVTTVKHDVQHVLGAEVEIALSEVGNQPFPFFANDTSDTADTILIDKLDVECSDYQRNAALLQTGETHVANQQLVSHLLRSFCPVTHQPDWASLTIRYTGRELDAKSLLRYVVSYREHQGFHEQCIEQIFLDLLSLSCFEKLTVAGQFTRRGGIDITPVRSTEKDFAPMPRINRQ